MTDVFQMRLNDDMYDITLSENICFIYLYDSSANNAIIECIARNCPILINKLPAVVEYLGDEYPFYYDTIEETTEKVHNLQLIQKTYEYLNGKLAYDQVILKYMREYHMIDS
jgi:hypothetical protein